MAGKFLVYEHVFPNGKKYIGITSNAKARFRNGKGYEAQGKIANAIKHYGWDNIQHNIIVDDLTKEQAEKLEKYLIAELHTIDEGYNTAIGGENVNGFYLNGYILAIIDYAKKHHTSMNDELLNLAKVMYRDRNNVEASGFWNEAERAVTLVYGKYSTTNLIAISSFLFHIREYLNLWVKMQNGEDVSDWKEEILPCDPNLGKAMINLGSERWRL